MASLTTNPKTSLFGDVAVQADPAGDTYAADPLVTLWVQNQEAVLDVVVTLKEQRQCNHSHHSLVDKEFTIGPGVTWVIEPQDVRYMATASRRVVVEYDLPTNVYVAAFRGY